VRGREATEEEEEEAAEAVVVEEEEAPLLLYSGSPLTVLCSTAPCQRSHGCPRERSVTVCGTLHEEGWNCSSWGKTPTATAAAAAAAPVLSVSSVDAGAPGATCFPPLWEAAAAAAPVATTYRVTFTGARGWLWWVTLFSSGSPSSSHEDASAAEL
jgi:hypothetical protein